MLILGTIDIDESAISQIGTQINDYRQIGTKAHQTTTSEFLNMILSAALRINASDVHFQPEEVDVKVRFRVDGVLHDLFSLETNIYLQIKKRIKLIGKLKINIENKPQDGALVLNSKNKKIDLRLSALPTHYGESLVIRLLNPDAIQLEFSALGIHGRALHLMQEKIIRSSGMILACGPTGSGKTTTLYTILKKLNREDTQIITLENPIEYKLEGILQTQIDDNLSFAQGLKTVLRQDPNIIMVGEIRDLETAETAISAALTGHLVVTTLHTNNAAGAIPRFLAMGAKGFMLAPSLNLIIAQRLTRRLCPDCKAPTTLPPELSARVKSELSQIPEEDLGEINLNDLHFFKAVGCPKCSGLGLQGRIGLFELLDISEKLIASIESAALTETAIVQISREQKMVTMLHDGFLKAAMGITSVEEILRVAD
ncbi:MAG: hypothetical protein A2445_02510 [Candidatus Jacksonbacteria bacterium RIFOXYC2_FULL_44_29]|nr:MAG: hypothetical protein A2240_02770 [Candidatus Jacksonbacteria bacterium RIFOXYA2_FULL_43_12]OGY77452.1 MAG: hypothetical protein A2295_01720 [Candidatus Jacksonbacteria bacterium RIFOXYB2_FULL_44_15]OGY78225.1 MAG: hypothetical protein A2550_06065 [Candidatus Jacksonbacteria bacterium RIFOXYD2_FULL_43_21]OGY80797.1 MAG: hypothetical protein A2445_02510 [Candidatus Jacksonbacteria bacterium RIFOXYC2_FULL_44_29]